ncbi:OB-fold domain-containing protein [Catenulispora sp. NF23]|uniref:OB-fold domain-containing protein n=1 Tax=Catenulispora pinistramenti TaxID=2705254 RepID=A0ABS5KNA8_9ACTN|nr:OB-fold domain-containing protein [Catenulispora pinistramenti]MBS2535686.1 OB-fold domain-containing protein [Catenulispora pinistramenti]MBS2547545.1 OB-fold domain-containing protein [Catenulispora pinistramenti]
MLKPLVDDDGAPYFEYAAKGELRMQTCANCGEVLFPPRPMCPRCQGIEFAWKLMSGRGHVWSFAVPHPPLLPDYAALAPYPVVVVELEEDRRLRVVGNLVAAEEADINSVDPATIEIGQPVRAVFREIEGFFVAAWIPDA